MINKSLDLFMDDSKFDVHPSAINQHGATMLGNGMIVASDSQGQGLFIEGRQKMQTPLTCVVPCIFKS